MGNNTTLEEIKKLMDEMKLEIIAQLTTRQVNARQVKVASLAEISKQLGIISSGEFRSGNNKEPGSGFSGVRIGYPAFVYGSDEWNIAGINNDTIQFGLSASDGRAYFAGGRANMGADGLESTELGYLFNQSANNAGTYRTAKIGMVVPSGTSTPAMQIQYASAAGAELVSNGGAEFGSTVGWTDASSAWGVVSTGTQAGSFSFKHDETDTGCPASLIQNVTGLTAGLSYAISFASKSPEGYFTPKVLLVWKTGGGATVSTTTILGTIGSSWGLTSQINICPATATNVDITLHPGDSFGDAYFDSVSFYLQDVFSTLTINPNFIIGHASVAIGDVALTTTATDGFLYLPTCAGVPTGVPTTLTGTKAFVYDTTNNHLYVYNDGWKKTTVFA